MADMEYNPFLDPPLLPLEANPFMDLDAAAAAEAQSPERMRGRKPRPGGKGFYSQDPAERMRQLHEDGKAGPQFAHLGGARRKADRRASEIVAEAAAENAEKIKQVYLHGLDFDNNIPYQLRLKAAEALIKTEGAETLLQFERDKAEFEAMNKAQLVENIVEMLGDLQRGGQVSDELLAAATDPEIEDADIID